MDASFRFPGDWHEILGEQTAAPYFARLGQFLAAERAEHEIFPPEDEVFSALSLTPYAEVKALILGQDPYHDNGQAHGLCFSVKPGIRVPPSLRNIYRELHADLGCSVPDHGFLEHWARQGVLMINAVLTVRAHQANSHKNQGWEQLTDAIIRAVNAKDDRVVFLLWGGYARKKAKLIDTSRHGLVEGAHPSPLSVKKFMGSRPFSRVNTLLQEAGREPIDWQIPPFL